MKRRYSCIAIILIMCILSACHNKKEESVSTSVNDTSVTTEASNDISDETRKLLELGEKGNKELIKAQREALGEIADEILGVCCFYSKK